MTGLESAALVPVSSLTVPRAVSKSVIRAMQCETYFAGHYLAADNAARLISSPLAQTGTDFHTWRAAYINYLVGAGQVRDPDWAAQWLAAAVVTDDARQLITDDIATFTADPEAVYAVELFLSMTEGGEPVEREIGAGLPGRITDNPRAVASGSLDSLELQGAVATIVDYKSGWATASVSDYEPPVYAALVFAHFSQVEVVNFKWEFVRLRANQEYSYTRDQFPELLAMIRGALARAADIAGRCADGGRITVDPWAGLCGYCALRCPLRALASTGSLVIPPIQNANDARQVAAVLYAARQVVASAGAALKPWLDQGGPLPVGGDFVADLAARFSTKKPLLGTLEVLGYDVSSMRGGSPAFMVPLESLTVGGLTSFAKTKMRAGLRDRLARVEKRTASTSVRIRRMSPGSQLLESAAADDGGEDEDQSVGGAPGVAA